MVNQQVTAGGASPTSPEKKLKDMNGGGEDSPIYPDIEKA